MDDEDFDVEGYIPEPEPDPPELVSRETFLAGIDADNNPIADLKWVFHALGAEGLKPEDAPSPGAWLLLYNLKNDPLLLKAFYSTVYPKLLPSRAEMAKGVDRANDDREHLDLVERLLKESRDLAPVLSRAERSARQLAIPTRSA
jgi:hypothetical protein